MKKIIVIMAGAFVLTGCVTNPSIPIPVDDDRFDGLWKGASSLNKVQVSGWRCTDSDKPIYFRVKDRVATSLLSHQSALFTAQVDESGNISFVYSTNVTENGVPRKLDTQFWGQLDSSSGSGEYRFLGCFGKWSVKKIAGSRKNPSILKPTSNQKDRVLSKDYQKPYINILVEDIVQAGGKPKFRVKAGDTLEIIREKTCLDGFGICFKVRNPDTGEWGFVTENRMKQHHDIVRKPTGSEKISYHATRGHRTDAGKSASTGMGEKVVFHSRYIDGFEVISRNCSITRRIHSPTVKKNNNSINLKWKVAFAVNTGCSEEANISMLQKRLDREHAIYEALAYINDSDQFDGYLSKSKMKKLAETEKAKSLVELNISDNKIRSQSGRNVSGYNVSGSDKLMQLIEVEAIVNLKALLDVIAD